MFLFWLMSSQTGQTLGQETPKGEARTRDRLQGSPPICRNSSTRHWASSCTLSSRLLFPIPKFFMVMREKRRSTFHLSPLLKSSPGKETECTSREHVLYHRGQLPYSSSPVYPDFWCSLSGFRAGSSSHVEYSATEMSVIEMQI